MTVARLGRAMRAALLQLYRAYVEELKSRADEEASRLRASGHDATRQMVVVILTVLFCLIFMKYFGSAARLEHWTALLRALGLHELAEMLLEALGPGEHQRIAQKVFWAAARVVGYVLIPLAVALVALRGRISLVELLGLRTRGFFVHARLYLLMLAVMIPFVVAASFHPSFQNKYPFYRLEPGEPLWPWFVAWEGLYALQFLALEVFYRGFMVHGLKARFGYGAIFVMMIPYMMIHFGKPLPECLGSIVAGFVLGTMSLKSGAIWWGAVLHVLVAWSMDGLSLWHQGLLRP